MNEKVLDILLTAAASMIITMYLPRALKGLWDILYFLWKYVFLPMQRLISFPFIRFYRDRYKKYEIKIMKFTKIDSLKKEFFYDWYRWIRWGGRYPMSHKEERRFLEYKEKEKNHYEKLLRK